MTSKGQFTLPKALRDEMGLKAGDQIDFEMNSDQKIVLKKVETPKKSLEELFQILRPAPIGRVVTLEEIEAGIIAGAIYGEGHE